VHWLPVKRVTETGVKGAECIKVKGVRVQGAEGARKQKAKVAMGGLGGLLNKEL
jgi:hypothetical protein